MAGFGPGRFREMLNPLAEREMIKKEMNPRRQAEIQKMVGKIDGKHELHKKVSALLTKYDQAIFVPDNELGIISKETDYSTAVIGALLNRIEKEKKEKRKK